jgi:NAD(P)-dependent dehydrogenase (short-subunit alcohol dehydrogenase family)
MRDKQLQGKVVVITGASSGLGRAAAIEFARHGCRLALGARRLGELEVTASMCRDAGAADVIAVVTDVTVERAVEHLADQALHAFGRVDIWVNNAGVTTFAPIEDGPFEVHQRVIETNLYGAIYGARAVIPLFKLQQSGVLINVGSMLSKVANPYVPAYVMSKFGVGGLTDTLRTELADYPNIHACTLLPYAFDSPHFESGANLMGVAAHPMPPQQSPEEVARALVSLARRPRRQLYVPRYAKFAVFMHALMPKTVERFSLHTIREWHFGFAPEGASTGNLFHGRHDVSTDVHGRRKARISFPRMLAWAAGRLAKRKPSQTLRPHAS